MTSFDLPQIPQPRVSPALLVGAASPLWSYFGAAAAGGVAYWWMTRWTRPVNLEALMAGATALEPLAAPVVTAVEMTSGLAEDVLEQVDEAMLELAPVAIGGEAAPMGPLDQIVEAPPIEAAPEPILDATPEPVIEEPAPVFAEPAAPKAKAKKAPPVEPEA